MSQADSKVNKPSVLSSEDILIYLNEHPEFLQQHPQILENQALDHECGDASSLLERQVKVLRQRVQDYANKLDGLVATAQRNDSQFEKTKDLISTLGGCQNLSQVTAALKASFIDAFQADIVKLIILQDSEEQAPDLVTLSANAEEAKALTSITEKTDAFCTPVKNSPLAGMLADTAKPMHSCAVLPIHYQQQALGLIIIASAAEDHYSKELDTLFLNHVATVSSEVVGRICG